MVRHGNKLRVSRETGRVRQVKMRMTRIVLVFLGVFWAVQKALPLLFRQGEFRGIGWTESLDWLTSFNSGIVSILVGAFVLMFCVWPLRTYSLFVTIPVAAGHSIFAGIVVFPYDLLEMGLISSGLNALVVLLWICLFIAPWLINVIRRRNDAMLPS